MMKILYLILFIVFTGCSSCKYLDGQHKINLPWVDSIIVDGYDNDWKQGLNFILQADDAGNSVERNDFFPRIKMGWNSNGILFYLEVQDDDVLGDESDISLGDGMELTLFTHFPSRKFINVRVSPGESSSTIYTGKYKIENQVILQDVIKSIYPGKYSLEFIIPFNDIEFFPSPGEQINCHLKVNDKDKGEEMISYSWFYGKEENSLGYPLGFVSRSENEKIHHVKGLLIDDELVEIYFFPSIDLKGEKLILKKGNKQVGKEVVKNQAIVFNHYIDDIDTDTSFYLFLGKKMIGQLNTGYFQKFYVNKPKPNRWEEEIKAFEREDKKNFPPKNAVLFIGSSSIRVWKDLPEDMKGLQVINRGFGGSTAEDALHFVDRIVIPYEPAKIVYYEGDNDIASGTRPEDFIKTTIQFIEKVHKNLPQSEIYLISVKPSLKRMDVWGKITEANKMLEELANKKDYVHYIDVRSLMLDDDGNLRNDIFLQDSIHLNRKGYDLWKSAIRPVLIK